MGCRSFLTPYVDEEGKPKYYGRFNQGVVTINLVDVALSSGRDETKFWEIFDQRLELCYRALMQRHNRLLGTLSDAAPILWQYGALARLKKGETIDKLLFGGYSTISLGYAGLYECVKHMTGKSHTDEEAKPFALAVMVTLPILLPVTIPSSSTSAIVVSLDVQTISSVTFSEAGVRVRSSPTCI